MDARRFDACSRLLSVTGSRRRALRIVAAAMTGSLVVDVANADANGVHRRSVCRPVGTGCSRGIQCCTGYCRRGKQLPRSLRDRCSCPDGEALCDGACLNVQDDVEHCGGCDIVCDSAEACCNGACANTDTAADHCGACGSACGAGTPDCCGGVCVDLAADSDNCGACGASCGGGLCASGACLCPETPACSTDTDCAGGVYGVCSGGTCRPACNADNAPGGDYYYCLGTVEGLVYDTADYRTYVLRDSVPVECCSTAVCEALPECTGLTGAWRCVCSEGWDETVGYNSYDHPRCVKDQMVLHQPT